MIFFNQSLIGLITIYVCLLLKVIFIRYHLLSVKLLFFLSEHLISLQEEHAYLEAAAFAMTPHDLMCDPH